MDGPDNTWKLATRKATDSPLKTVHHQPSLDFCSLQSSANRTLNRSVLHSTKFDFSNITCRIAPELLLAPLVTLLNRLWRCISLVCQLNSTGGVLGVATSCLCHSNASSKLLKLRGDRPDFFFFKFWASTTSLSDYLRCINHPNWPIISNSVKVSTKNHFSHSVFEWRWSPSPELATCLRMHHVTFWKQHKSAFKLHAIIIIIACSMKSLYIVTTEQPQPNHSSYSRGPSVLSSPGDWCEVASLDRSLELT